ncbi:hypothetical protein EE612_027157, partial [Oryza sativa]
LAPAGRCYVCRVAVAGGEYRRCYALERLVDAIRVACPHAAHGCAARPAYHDVEAHRLACPHGPCHCPGERCGFVGSTAALLDHFAATHNWPCTTNVRAREVFDVRLHDGFNFLVLAPAGRCHVCRVAVAGGEYRRCYALERLVDAIRVACPHAAHGCGATPAYHALDAHRRACPHAPCHCPGERCGFVGSTVALQDHIAATHSWPCTTNVRAGETVSVHLRDGLAFLRVHHHRRRGSATYSDHLIMLNVTREPYGRAVSVLCIRPHAAAEHQVSPPPPPAMQCELLLVSRFGYDGDGGHCRSHYQKSEFLIGCSDLADGLPDREQSFQFMVPRCVVGDDDEGGIQIHVRIIVIN